MTTNWTFPTVRHTASYTFIPKQGSVDSTFRLLIDATHFLLIDTTFFLIIGPGGITPVNWSYPIKN